MKSEVVFTVLNTERPTAGKTAIREYNLKDSKLKHLIIQSTTPDEALAYRNKETTTSKIMKALECWFAQNVHQKQTLMLKQLYNIKLMRWREHR